MAATTVVTLKATAEELALIDWLVRSYRSGSRSQAIRQALRSTALVRGIRHAELDRVEDARREAAPRRSTKGTRCAERKVKGISPTGAVA